MCLLRVRVASSSHRLQRSFRLLTSSSNMSYFGGRHYPNISSHRFSLNYTCGVFRSFNVHDCSLFSIVFHKFLFFRQFLSFFSIFLYVHCVLVFFYHFIMFISFSIMFMIFPNLSSFSIPSSHVHHFPSFPSCFIIFHHFYIIFLSLHDLSQFSVIFISHRFCFRIALSCEASFDSRPPATKQERGKKRITKNN